MSVAQLVWVQFDTQDKSRPYLDSQDKDIVKIESFLIKKRWTILTVKPWTDGLLSEQFGTMYKYSFNTYYVLTKLLKWSH